MIEVNDVKEILSDVIEEDDFELPFLIYALGSYESNTHPLQIAEMFKEALLGGNYEFKSTNKTNN